MTDCIYLASKSSVIRKTFLFLVAFNINVHYSTLVDLPTSDRRPQCIRPLDAGAVIKQQFQNLSPIHRTWQDRSVVEMPFVGIHAMRQEEGDQGHIAGQDRIAKGVPHVAQMGRGNGRVVLPEDLELSDVADPASGGDHFAVKDPFFVAVGLDG